MKRYALVNGILLNGHRDMQPQHGYVVFVDGEIISNIRKCSPDEIGSGYQIVDLQGGYLMPGLINLHVHLPASGKPFTDPKKYARLQKLIPRVNTSTVMQMMFRHLCETYAKTELMSGVTTIRTVGGLADIDTRVRDRIQSGKIPGPRIQASNMGISVPGGHMAGTCAYAATSPEEAVSFVRQLAGQGVDLIKLMITGGVLHAEAAGEPGVLRMPPEMVRAACQEAHRLGYRVAAHVEGPEGLKVALENGVDTVEHGAVPDEDCLQLFRKNGAALIVTLSPALPYAEFDPNVSDADRINGKAVLDGIIFCARACLEQDIPVGLGTDTGCSYVTHYGTWRELCHFVRYCGVSNAFALYTATLRNAEIAGLGDLTGSVDIGKEADLIITRENPLEDLRALRNVETVISRGRLILSPKFKTIPEVDAVLDTRG